MLKPRNLFLPLAAVAGVLALIFKFAVHPSLGMPDPSHLAFTFASIMGLMGAISLIYLVMEKIKGLFPARSGGFTMLLRFLLWYAGLSAPALLLITQHGQGCRAFYPLSCL